MSRKASPRKLPANYMDVVYRRAEGLAFHDNDKGLTVLDVENTGFYNRIAQRFFHRPRVSHIALDKYGTALWRLLDGERSVFCLVQEMKAAFPDEEDRMLDRCVQFLHTLEVNRFIRH